VGTKVGAGEGFRVDTSVTSELVSTTKVVLRLDAKVMAKEVLFRIVPTDAAYAVPVVFAISETTAKSAVQVYAEASSLRRRCEPSRSSPSCLRLLPKVYVKTQPRISSLSTPSSVSKTPFNDVLSFVLGAALAVKSTDTFILEVPPSVGAGVPVGLKVGAGKG
jgi:hypothetical protein